jgi:hypothetical protein
MLLTKNAVHIVIPAGLRIGFRSMGRLQLDQLGEKERSAVTKPGRVEPTDGDLAAPDGQAHLAIGDWRTAVHVIQHLLAVERQRTNCRNSPSE